MESGRANEMLNAEFGMRNAQCSAALAVNEECKMLNAKFIVLGEVRSAPPFPYHSAFSIQHSAFSIQHFAPQGRLEGGTHV
jgi:hypothetical protein